MKYVRHHFFGSFEIVAHLDSGGMADVYLARHREDQNLLGVVKTLHEQLKNEPEMVAMFQDEGRIMTRLDHPNVVKVFEFGEAEGLPFMSMEYLAGDHLGVLHRAARRLGEQLSPSLIARIFLQVANGLTYVHGAKDEAGKLLGLVHRDISPQNIFCCYDGRIKLLDFGVALFADRSVATRTGMLKGKIRYMSPEQINNAAIDGRSDLFAAGIVMWEVLSGTGLFRADSEYRIMKMICEEEIPEPQREDLPPALKDIVMCCLERSPDRRYDNAGELRRDLSNFLFSQGTQSSPNELPQTASHLLGERRMKKEAIVASVRRADALQECLFGDLGDGLGSSPSFDGPGLVSTDQVRVSVPLPSPRPASTRPSPPSAPAPLDMGEEPTQTETETELRTPASHRRLIWILSVCLVVLVAAGAVGAWYLWGGKPAPNQAPVPPKPDKPEVAAELVPAQLPDAGVDAGVDAGIDAGMDAGTDAGVDAGIFAGVISWADAGEPEVADAGKGPIGYLNLDTNPPTDVFLDDQYLGKTPVVDMELKPGKYTVKLQNPSAGINRTLPIEITAGKVTSHRFVY